MQLFKRYFDTRAMLPRSMPADTLDLPSSSSMYSEYIRIALPSVMEAVLISLINMMDSCVLSMDKKMVISVISHTELE